MAKQNQKRDEVVVVEQVGYRTATGEQVIVLRGEPLPDDCPERDAEFFRGAGMVVTVDA